MWSKRFGIRRGLATEILFLFAVCLVVTLAVYFFLAFFGVGIAESYCWEHDIALDEEASYHLNAVVFGASLVISVLFFVILFLVLFGERLAYIGTIIKGVDALRRGEYGYRLPIEGKNELTRLAEEINYLSVTEAAIKEKERRLYEEREELIRTLSHDIRTPLTSLISYTELYAARKAWTPEEMSAYFSLVRKKTGQIKDLSEILLDGGKRETEYFEDGKLLVTQLVGEFEEALEGDFALRIDLASCSAFSGRFHVEELRRLFDNLSSNVRKYADPTYPVSLVVSRRDDGLIIRQTNAVRAQRERTESYRMGLYSIRRIAYHYGGEVTVREEDGTFEITVKLAEF